MPGYGGYRDGPRTNSVPISGELVRLGREDVAVGDQHGVALDAEQEVEIGGTGGAKCGGHGRLAHIRIRLNG